jgi:DNA-binding FadR family transcriptional regulator
MNSTAMSSDRYRTRVLETTGRPGGRGKTEYVAGELRAMILSGQVAEGDLVGNERDLLERFEVSRPCLREALRLLEGEGLIRVSLGIRGGVFARLPDERLTTRATAMVFQARSVDLWDVIEGRALIEPVAVRRIALSPARSTKADALRAWTAEQEARVDDPSAFSRANARFHRELVRLAESSTLSLMLETLNGVIAEALDVDELGASLFANRRVRRQSSVAQLRLAGLVATRDAATAEEFWRGRMLSVGRLAMRHAGCATSQYT